jgi:hypothetical protein
VSSSIGVRLDLGPPAVSTAVCVAIRWGSEPPIISSIRKKEDDANQATEQPYSQFHCTHSTPSAAMLPVLEPYSARTVHAQQTVRQLWTLPIPACTQYSNWFSTVQYSNRGQSPNLGTSQRAKGS